MPVEVIITGGQGFIGAYIIRQLIRENCKVLIVDLKKNDCILEQVLTTGEVNSLNRIYGDVSDFEFLNKVFEDNKPKYVIHLAGLQIPTCKSQPHLGARVNVVGTTVVFECARRARVVAIVYASSAGVCGATGDYDGAVKDSDVHTPRTHYGVFKLCNEGTARIYFQDHRLPSAGLRPLVVFGVGREVGLTSDPSKAVKAAVLGRCYPVRFAGPTAWNYVVDVARIFVDCLRALEKRPGAYTCNLAGTTLSVPDFLKVAREQVTDCGGEQFQVAEGAGKLPFPSEFEESNLELLLGRQVNRMSISDSLKDMVSQFERLNESGLLHTSDLDR
eukprot:222240_1